MQSATLYMWSTLYTMQTSVLLYTVLQSLMDYFSIFQNGTKIWLPLKFDLYIFFLFKRLKNVSRDEYITCLRFTIAIIYPDIYYYL